MRDLKKHIGEEIRDARRKSALSSKEMGLRLGITEGAYNRYESGKYNLTLDTIHKICTAMGVDFRALID
jgi:transcriptional regulator with XRE-family HTH domain